VLSWSASIVSYKGSRIGWGPKCAKAAGVEIAREVRIRAPERATEANPAQMELWA
jgi:hypothetical protein